MPDSTKLLLKLFDLFPFAAVKSRALDRYEPYKMGRPSFPYLPQTSFHQFLVEKHVLSLPATETLTVVDRNAGDLGYLLAGSGSTRIAAVESVQFAENLGLPGPMLHKSLGAKGHGYHYLDGLCCLDPDCSSYVLRKPGAMVELGRAVKRVCLFVFSMDPKSLEDGREWDTGFITRDATPLYRQHTVRAGFHRAGFYDVADVMTIIDGMPYTDSVGISRAGMGPHSFVARRALSIPPAAQTTQVYLASKSPLTMEIM
ncbi:MAG: hypothetical protein V2B18_21585 [Pseudomonadota bacterium]